MRPPRGVSLSAAQRMAPDVELWRRDSKHAAQVLRLIGRRPERAVE